MTILQQNSGAIADGSTAFTVTLPQTSAGTSRVVVAVLANNVVTAPGGFTSRSPQVATAGHYLFDAAGGASSWSFTMGTGHGSWHVYEVASGAFLTSNGANGGGAASQATPSLTPAANTVEIIATIGGVSTSTRSISSWTGGFTEVFENVTNNTGGTEFLTHGTALLSTTANGSTAYTTTATYSAATNVASSGIIAAYSTVAPVVTQTAVPIADVTTTGWTSQLGATSSLYTTLDEASPSDTDYVISPASPTASSPFEVQITSLTDPNDHTGHTVSYRFRSTGTSSTVVVQLVEGTTVRASSGNITTNPAAFTTGTFTLSEAEAAAITNYGNLRIRVLATAS